MRVLVIDPCHMFGLEVVQRLVRDGHEVVYAPVSGPMAEDPLGIVLGKGIGAKVDPEGWTNWIDWADVATVTGVEHRGHIVNFLRKVGVPVVGSGRWASKVEVHRDYGKKIFTEMGMTPAKSRVFYDFDKLISFIKKNPAKYVLKVDGRARTAMETIVSREEDGRDLLDAITKVRADLFWDTEGQIPFHLEDFIEGAEVAFGGWFNGKKIMGDQICPCYDGEYGFVYDLRVDEGKAFDRERVARVLAANNYRGPFDINGILGEDGSYHPIEWTMRWGAGLTEAFCHGVEDMGNFLRACATGGDDYPFRAAFKGKVLAVANIVLDEDQDRPLQVFLPKGKKLPLLTKDSSLWVTWPAVIGDRVFSLPILKDTVTNIATYVGVGKDLGDAMKQVAALAEEAEIADCSMTPEALERELGGRIETYYRHARGEGWIRREAREMRHYFTSPLK